MSRRHSRHFITPKLIPTVLQTLATGIRPANTRCCCHTTRATLPPYVGAFSRALAPHAESVTGIDIAASAVQHAKALSQAQDMSAVGPAGSRRGGSRLPIGRRRSLLDVEMPQIRRGLVLLGGHQITLGSEHIMLFADEHVIEVFGAVILGPHHRRQACIALLH